MAPSARTCSNEQLALELEIKASNSCQHFLRFPSCEKSPSRGHVVRWVPSFENTHVGFHIFLPPKNLCPPLSASLKTLSPKRETPREQVAAMEQVAAAQCCARPAPRAPLRVSADTVGHLHEQRVRA